MEIWRDRESRFSQGEDDAEMTAPGHERFVVRKPLRLPGYPVVSGRQAPPMTFLSSTQVPEAEYYIELSWIYGVPDPNPHMAEHVLDYDEILLHIGFNPDTPQDLGATIELYLGGQSIVLNTTSSVFIPKGTPRGPLTWKEVHRPHLQMSMILGSGDPFGTAGRRGMGRAGDSTPRKRQNFDYEQYVVRSPMREAGPNYVEGRQNPTMTYMSRTQINAVNNYIEFGWIWDVPEPPIPKMRHDTFDEIVLHIGSDPDKPEDLGGVLLCGLGDETVELDTNHCIYIPKGMDHGPLVWKEVRRPLVEMAIMLGAGTLNEGWENSFFDLPDGSRRGPK
jgi:hypothetical protein